MRFEEAIQVLRKFEESLSDALAKLVDFYQYSIVYKAVYNRKGNEYRYLYLNSYGSSTTSKYIGKVEDPELAEKLYDLRFRQVVRKLEVALRSLKEVVEQLESVGEDVEVLARLYDYICNAVREGRIDGSKEQVRIALEMLKPFKDLVS